MLDKHKSLTVFTPTYNRANILCKCYESLVRQTNKDFMWIIVDDGSSDNTEEVVSKWKTENKIEILYIKQTNGGKQRAHNSGVEACDTELFLCVDSDDYLTDDAVETMLSTWQKVDNKKEIAGVIALKGNYEGKPISSMMPPDILTCPLTDLYELHNFKGDTALLYRTEILKLFPFTVIEGEKFMSEEFVYRQIDQHYSMYLLNRIVCICEYLIDGYTVNSRNIIKKNPKGYTLLKKQAAILTKSKKFKIKHTICYIIGCHISKEKYHYIRNSNNKALCILLWLPSVIAYYIRYR